MSGQDGWTLGGFSADPRREAACRQQAHLVHRQRHGRERRIDERCGVDGAVAHQRQIVGDADAQLSSCAEDAERQVIGSGRDGARGRGAAQRR